MWLALAQLFRCVAIALRVWSRLKTYELENNVRIANEADENEIERLRALAAGGVDPDGNSLRADRLRERIDRRNLIPADLLAEGSDPQIGATRANASGDLHPAS